MTREKDLYSTVHSLSKLIMHMKGLIGIALVSPADFASLSSEYPIGENSSAIYLALSQANLKSIQQLVEKVVKQNFESTFE